MKIKVYPTPEQKNILKNWFGTSRYIYNKILNKIENENHKKNFQELRNKFITKETSYKKCLGCNKIYKTNKKNFKCCENFDMQINKKENKEINEWEYNTPKEIRAHSIKDLIKAYKVAFINKKNGNIQKFKMNYRKKNQVNSIVIQKSSIKYVNGYFDVYPKTLGKLKVGKRSNKKDYNIENDTRMLYNGKDYYICILQKYEKKEYKDRKDLVALDPGLRTFITGYSPQETFKISRDKELLEKYRKKLDKLISLRKGKKYIIKWRDKIKNFVDDLHWKAISYLTKNYKIILLPTFESQKMLGNNKKVNRDFNEFKHYKFKMRLLDKSKEIKNTKVLLVGEEYTSKTCSKCGYIKYDLKNSKIFKCNRCSLKIDRDINGSRNIFNKNVSMSSLQGI